jgi:hypothetical protein
VNNKNGNKVSLTVQPAIVVQPQVSPAMASPLPKAKKWKRTKKSEVLSSSPYKNALRTMRKEPSNNKQAGKLFVMTALQ